MNAIVTHCPRRSSHIFDFSPEAIEKIGAGSRDRTGILSLEECRAFSYPLETNGHCAAVPRMFTPLEFKSMRQCRHRFFKPDEGDHKEEGMRRPTLTEIYLGVIALLIILPGAGL